MNKIDKKAIPLFGLRNFPLTLIPLYLMSMACLVYSAKKKFNLAPIELNTMILIVIILLGLLIALSIIHGYFYWKSYSYLFDKDGYHQNHGIFFKHTIFIPYNKISEIDLHQGPLERHLGLASLKIYTMGISTSPQSPRMGQIYLRFHEAIKIRDSILNKIQS